MLTRAVAQADIGGAVVGIIAVRVYHAGSETVNGATELIFSAFTKAVAAARRLRRDI